MHNAQHIDKTLNADSLKFKNLDAYMATLLSILDLQIDILRLKLTLQENPAFVKALATGLIEKTERYQTLWTSIENNPRNVEDLAQSLKESIHAMNGWQKLMPRWMGGKREQRKASENVKDALIGLNTRAKTDDMVETAKAAIEFGKTVSGSVEQAILIYWRDEQGHHSYYTNDLSFK